MSEVILIPSTTESVTTASQVTHEGQGYNYPGFPVCLWAWDLAGDEKVEVQLPTDKADPDDYVTVIELTPDRLHTAIYSPLPFRLKKSATSATSGVAMSKVRGV